MKVKTAIIILNLLCAISTWAQPHHQYFNTGIAGSGAGNLFVPSGSQTVGASDIHWQVSTAINGTYVTPIVVNPCTNSSPNVTGFPWSMWISYPFPSVPPNNHSSYSGTLDLYYKITFVLPANPSFSTDWIIFGNDWIQDIYVNTNPLSPTPVWSSLLPYNTPPYNANTGLSFKWCHNWVAGVNTVIIHTVSQPSSNPPPYQGDDCTGLKVEAYPRISLPILGSATVCPNTLNTYTATVIQPTPVPASVSLNYSWTVPPTWSGGSGTFTMAANSSTSSGLINAYAWSTNGSGPNQCWATEQMSVNVWPASVTITPSSLSVCPGGSVSLTASGASSYTWIVPGGSPSNLNPFIVNPQAATVYTLEGKTINGCIARKTVTISMLPIPNVSVFSNPNFICSAMANTLTAGGGVGSYTWSTSPGITSSTINVNLSPLQTVTVTGSGSNGCTNTATISLNTGSVVPVSASNVTLCTNAASCVAITATGTPLGAWPLTYNWQPNNLPGQNQSVCPTVNSIYTVTAMSIIGCPGTATMAVSITTNCCSQPTTGLIPLTSLNTTVNGGSYFLHNSITVTGPVILKNLEILIMPGAKITVPPAANSGLYLENVHLYSCGLKMWQGIEVMNGAFFGTTNYPNSTTLIEDAEVAIDMSGTSLANTFINLNQIIFNKNYISIYMRNVGPAATTYSLPLTECVFTSRSLPFAQFPNPLSWPNAGVGASGLRFVASPTTGLAMPYNLQGYTQSNLKQSYQTPPTFTNQPAHIGIKIENVGNVVGGGPSGGLQVGPTLTTTINDPAYFNLFDGLGKGIEVTDADLSTSSNVFQNMQRYQTASGLFGGIGIEHTINSSMNATLDLRPIAANPSTDFGNRFWNCQVGVDAQNVYDVNIESAVFRSTHSFLTPSSLGANGIVLKSNRFKYTIKNSEFNNIENSILVDFQSGAYNIAGVSGNGTYADALSINQNYFGPQVTSTTAIGQGYSGTAINITGINANNWQLSGVCNVLSNKMDRVYRGIRVESTDKYPVEIGGNKIQLSNAMINTSNDQYGIYASGTKDDLTISQNSVTGTGVSNQTVKLIRCADNTSASGTRSPEVFLNEVRNAYKGFAFEGSQPNTDWLCNDMYTPMNFGFSIENAGVIGQQGSAVTVSGNRYLGGWNAGSFYTNAVGSSFPINSKLYVALASGVPVPTHAGSPTYANGPTFNIVYVAGTPSNPCRPSVFYPSTPSQRTMSFNAAQIEEINPTADAWNVEIYPNPSNGSIRLTSTVGNEVLTVRVIDLSGKAVFVKSIGGDSERELDLSMLESSIYLIEVQNQNKQIVRRKLIKTE